MAAREAASLSLRDLTSKRSLFCFASCSASFFLSSSDIPAGPAACSFFRSKSLTFSSEVIGTLLKRKISLPSWESTMLYDPAATPREKYSPLLLVFRVYLRPDSRPVNSTVAPARGLPSRPLQVPLTVPVCAESWGTKKAAANTARIRTEQRCFGFIVGPPGSCRFDSRKLDSESYAHKTAKTAERMLS